MDKVSENQIRLISIEPLKIGAVNLDSTKIVKMAVLDESSRSSVGRGEILTVSLSYSSNEYKDEDLVRIAKADFYALCQNLVEIAKSWALTDEQRAYCKRHELNDDVTFSGI